MSQKGSGLKMFAQEWTRLEGEFYRSLNSVVEPLVRAGVGSPVLWAPGAIVLESTGRNTGRRFNVPLIATRVGDLVLVSTVRSRSQWLKNLATNTQTRYWMGGRLHEATAFVFAPGIASTSLDDMPTRASCLAKALISQSNVFGVGFAILAPRQSN